MDQKGMIRKITATQTDIAQMMCGQMNLEMDEEYLYWRTDMFGESAYLCWSRQMELRGPGELAASFYGRLDYGDGARMILDRYVDGLSNCTLRLFPGQLWSAERAHNGTPTFEAYPASTNAPEVLIMATWMADRPPLYNRQADAPFTTDLGIKGIWRIEPDTDDDSDGTGYDLWLVTTEKMGKHFAELCQLWDSFHHCASLNKWRDFDLQREFYRKKMEDELAHSGFTLIGFEFTSDYVQVRAADARASEAIYKEKNVIMYRCWYNEDGLQKLKGLWQLLKPVEEMAAFARSCGYNI